MSKHYIVVTEESLETYKKFKKEMEDEENKIEKEKENKDTEEDKESLGSDPWDCTGYEWGYFMEIVAVEQDKVTKGIQTSEQARAELKKMIRFISRGYIPRKVVEKYENYKMEPEKYEDWYENLTYL